MCVFNVSKIKTFDKDTIVYKLVDRQGNYYISPWKIRDRYSQVIDGILVTQGTCIEYQIGELVFSRLRDTPGIYTYASRDSARRYARRYSFQGLYVMRILCKAGSKYREATRTISKNSSHCILIEEGFCLNIVGRYHKAKRSP